MKKEIRNLKIASVLHRAISRVLMEGKVFNKNVAVSDVKLSKDLKKADVYIVLSSLNIQIADYSDSEKSTWISASRIGDPFSKPSENNCDINTVVNEMNQSAWSIRKSILCYVDLRFIPELVFKPDLAFDNFVNVSKILHNHT
ncbi:ribosome-binding factor A [Wolbachia endosymbiont of Drosophila tsacasi]|uniref:ribosome-binding factor A n=1 Tax=Wolbachia endosymbiont of Drosophila tsacasi TaxID=3002579 RepID=UPI0023A971F1|nr:ribosome-binding factor A [Wolbachia endosymbiont of Drosophila tsacasi]MDE5062228.1 ribosome-binding factor A [Wolbachia endosymbiont of Drosophila tsacasi]